ncbi:MAG: amidohydrolase family protein [Clostridia bacterium]|nr:amidohydrolase family protein [Clostridia bacterium]
MTQPRKIIDFHVHIFPEKIAAKAVAATGNYYGIEMDHNGTIDDLLVSGAKIGCSRYLVHSTATRPEQVISVNDFIRDSAAAHPEFIPFGTLHPKMENLEAEVERMIGMGMLGVKMHPDFQEFKVDDDDVLYMYAALEGRLPVLLHMGDINTDKTTPERLHRVVERFPNLTVIGAHFSGYSVWDRAEKELAGTGIYVDTSSSLPFLTPERATELVHAFGADHCLFGSDYPMWDHAEELERFMKLDLSDKERELILYKNAERLLAL